MRLANSTDLIGSGRTELTAQAGAPASVAPPALPGAPVRVEVRVAAVRRHGDEVAVLSLSAPPQAGFAYRPGQHLSVILEDGSRRTFSMASPWREDGQIELHIRRRADGRFSGALLDRLEAGDRLTLEGPFGGLGWRAQGARPAIFLATGTGLAPIKALLQHRLAQGDAGPLRLYWGVRRPSDLYMASWLNAVQSWHAAFSFVPVLSRPDAEWPGRRGYVQDAVAADFRSLADTEIYACGAPGMIDDARRTLGVIDGFDPERFFAESFEPGVAQAADSGGDTAPIEVIWGGRVRRIEAPIGRSLLAALQAAQAPVLSICGGCASCGACRVTVDPDWLDRLAPPERTERRLLANLDEAGPHDRLSCQIRLTAAEAGLRLRLDPTPDGPR